MTGPEGSRFHFSKSNLSVATGTGCDVKGKGGNRLSAGLLSISLLRQLGVQSARQELHSISTAEAAAHHLAIVGAIQRHITTIRTIAQQEHLSATRLERIAKAERVDPKMQATIEFVSGSLRQQVSQLALPQQCPTLCMHLSFPRTILNVSLPPCWSGKAHHCGSLLSVSIHPCLRQVVRSVS